MSLPAWIIEAEAFIAKWLPVAVTGAEVGATISGNPELDPIIAAAGSASEAALAVAGKAQNGDLMAAVAGVAGVVQDAKAVVAAAGPVAQPESGGGPGSDDPPKK